MATVKNANNKFMVSSSNHYCHDCRAKIEIKDKKIKNGFLCVYENGGEKFTAFKCNDCFARNPTLTNFRKCEVYSRVVGYLRPVQQWNLGKKEEFGERKEYKLTEDCS
ncbi:MAG: hypothetical protein A2Z78_01680 [Candidatus Nealsonbacteria bacterium RBG_13_36_15]|uniref:Uncharacterized protein n=1 Tax=Candidatus Nealsonbacteria bacterium RBG_13_36_15 TaxID=1801660 RepID=A0A1G2DWS4_9BACT|nr:MAG: hypothetical protein A2Z78_01680 [Candidatus Nealsonbacteria bacterium RBG_13_36_15]